MTGICIWLVPFEKIIVFPYLLSKIFTWRFCIYFSILNTFCYQVMTLSYLCLLLGSIRACQSYAKTAFLPKEVVYKKKTAAFVNLWLRFVKQIGRFSMFVLSATDLYLLLIFSLKFIQPALLGCFSYKNCYSVWHLSNLIL